MGEPEDMDMFEAGWSLQEGGAKKQEPTVQKVGALMPDLGKGSVPAAGFLPSIGGSATARPSGAQAGLTPQPPRGSQSARSAIGSLPSLTSVKQPGAGDGAGAAQRERQAKQKKVDSAIFEKAFYVIDKDKSGTVEPDEIVSCLKIFGKDVDRKRFWQVFKEADKDGSDSLDLEEFVDMMVRVTEKTRAAKAKRANTLNRKFKLGAMQAAVEKKKEAERAKYQGGRRKPAVKKTEGAEWRDGLLAQHRGLADIYVSRKRLQRMALGAGLIEPDEDPRMRTMLGRRVITMEKANAAAAAKSTKAALGNMDAIDAFSNMFGQGPAPPEGPPPANGKNAWKKTEEGKRKEKKEIFDTDSDD